MMMRAVGVASPARARGSAVRKKERRFPLIPLLKIYEISSHAEPYYYYY